ncbi:hypothetical protein AAMO2058_000042400 [Amorphochlora amoebiformis]
MGQIFCLPRSGNHEKHEKKNALKRMHSANVNRDVIIKANPFFSDKVPLGSKVVYFVRHGQGYHNVAGAESKFKCDCMQENSGNCPYLDPKLVDPHLTQVGIQQTSSLSIKTSSLPLQPEVIFVSPLCRAIQTGLLSFRHLVDQKETKVAFIADERIREHTGAHRCDERRPLREIKKEFPLVDFTRIKDEKDTMFGPEREHMKYLLNRAYDFMVDLAKRDEKVVAICSHSTWLLAVFACLLDIQEPEFRQWFKTGEMRPAELSWKFKS